MKSFNNRLNVLNGNVKKMFTDKMKKNYKDLSVYKDIVEHFKRPDAWPLGYRVYSEVSKLNEIEFNYILEKAKCIIYYDDNAGALYFKKGSIK